MPADMHVEAPEARRGDVREGAERRVHTSVIYCDVNQTSISGHERYRITLQ